MNTMTQSPPEPATLATRATGSWLKLRKLAPGSALSSVIALAATFVSTLHGGPQLLYALLFGVAFHYLSHDEKTRPGIEFCGRGVLRLGVGLLGARITAAQVAGLGWETALTVVAALVTTMLCGLAIGKRLGMTPAQRVLSGGAVAICGASAALAISSVLPREKDGDRFTLMVVVTVTVMSTLAMVLYPLIARLLHLPPELAGLFIGGTIHDVAQVVGAGYILGHDAGDIATIAMNSHRNQGTSGCRAGARPPACSAWARSRAALKAVATTTTTTQSSETRNSLTMVAMSPASWPRM